MPLFTTGLTYLCMNLASTGQYNTACNKAAEAGTKQVGVYKLLDDGERKTMQMAADFGQDTLGKTVMEVGGAGVFAYRVYRDKSVTFKLPNIGISDTISNRVTTNSYILNLGWQF